MDWILDLMIRVMRPQSMFYFKQRMNKRFIDIRNRELHVDDIDLSDSHATPEMLVTDRYWVMINDSGVRIQEGYISLVSATRVNGIVNLIFRVSEGENDTGFMLGLLHFIYDTVTGHVTLKITDW